MDAIDTYTQRTESMCIRVHLTCLYMCGIHMTNQTHTEAVYGTGPAGRSHLVREVCRCRATRPERPDL